MSVIDMLALLARRWRVLLICALLGVVVGTVLWVTYKPHYLYSSFIQVGRVGKDVWVESSESMQSKIESVYYPMAIQGSSDPACERMRIHCSVSSGAMPFISLSTKGTIADEAYHLEIHKRILALVTAEHEEVLSLTKKQLENHVFSPGPQSDPAANDLMFLNSVQQPSRCLGPSRSSQPVGPGAILQFALSSITGLILGIGLALFAEVASRVRAQLASPSPV